MSATILSMKGEPLLSLEIQPSALQLEPAPRYRSRVDEDEAALAFVKAYAGQIKYQQTCGAWFYWDGARWRLDRSGYVLELARHFVRGLSGHCDGVAKAAMGRASYAENVERIARTNIAIAVEGEQWDADEFLLGTPDGTLDLKSGVLRPSNPSDLMTKQTLVAPSRNEDCPRWLQFLYEATCGDDELISFLKRFVGYSLTGSVREHALAFIHGDGGNGKSVFANVIGKILRDYAVVAPMEAFTSQAATRHETELAMLAGSRLVQASETKEGRAWDEQRLTKITGGDPIPARIHAQGSLHI